jgi:hypothetical protein
MGVDTTQVIDFTRRLIRQNRQKLPNGGTRKGTRRRVLDLGEGVRLKGNVTLLFRYEINEINDISLAENLRESKPRFDCPPPPNFPRPATGFRGSPRVIPEKIKKTFQN